MSRTIDELGNKYGRLKVIDSLGGGRWKCQCDCGNTHKVKGYSLRNGGTRSCGCLERSQNGPMVKCPLKGDTIRIKEFAKRHNIPHGTVVSRYRKGLRGVALITMQRSTNRGTEEFRSLSDKPRGMNV